MKKTLLALLLAVLLLMNAAALAAMPDSLAEGDELKIDLNGDGAPETVSWRSEELLMNDGEDEYTEDAVVVHILDGEKEITYQVEMSYGVSVYVVTLPNAENPQILVTGDMMSDDYATQCLFYQDSAIYERVFRDIGRGEIDNPYARLYTLYGYGGLVDIAEDGTLTLNGTQDALGTYGMTRTVKLMPSGRFETNDDNIWHRAFMEEIDWEGYSVLTLKQPLPVTIVENDEKTETALATGSRIAITGTDKIEYIWFVTEDGQEGYIDFFPNYMDGWGICINDIPESDYFEFLPYAD